MAEKYLYKIGNLYIKSSENDYIDKYYQKADISISDEEYYKQIQPFIESDKIKIYNNENYDIYSFCIRNYSIYDVILDKLGIYDKEVSNYNNLINANCSCSCTDDEEEWKDECFDLVDKYNNGKYIPKSKFITKNMSNDDKYINYYEMKELIEMPLDEFSSYNIDYDLSYRKNTDFWRDINDIFYFDKNGNENLSSILKINCNVLDKFIDKIKKYKRFFKKFNSNIHNELKQLLKLDNIVMGAILIDKLNLFDEFQSYYFDKEMRIKQINKALEYQNIFKTIYPKLDKNENDYNINKCSYAIAKKNNEYKFIHHPYNIGNPKHIIGFNVKEKYLDYNDIVRSFVEIENTKYINLQFIYNPYINNCHITHLHNLKFYHIGNDSLFIGNCEYTKNKYLSNLVIDNSKLFEEYAKIYSHDELYNFDVSKELKDYNTFKKYFMDQTTAAKLIDKLIDNINIDYIDDEMKNIFYNIYYLQMFDILKMIGVITNRKIPINIYNILNTDNVINLIFDLNENSKNEKLNENENSKNKDSKNEKSNENENLNENLDSSVHLDDSENLDSENLDSLIDLDDLENSDSENDYKFIDLIDI